MYRRRYARSTARRFGASRKYFRAIRGRGAYDVVPAGVGVPVEVPSAKVSTKKRTLGKVKKSSSNFIGKTLGTIGGGIIGGLSGGLPGVATGAGIGSEIGSMGQELFRTITGRGAYNVMQNTLLGSSDPPMMHGSGSSVRVRHREFIKDVVSNASANTFDIKTYAINPNIAAVFPWLSNLAQNFQEWVPLGMIFEYKSSSSDALNSTNTALGNVILSTQYNSNQAAFKTKQQMENSQYTVSCKPSLSAMHAIECDPKQMVAPRLYIQKPTTATNDLRFQNLGNFSIATDGFQGTSVKCGELWVTYDILLCFPIQDSSNSNLADHWSMTPGNISTSNYFDYVYQSVNLKSSSNFGCTLGAATITFPVGFSGPVAITIQYVGASTALVNPTITPGTGVTALNLLRGDTDAILDVGNITSTIQLFTAYFTVVDPGTGVGASVTFSGGTLPGTMTYADLIVQVIANTN